MTVARCSHGNEIVEDKLCLFCWSEKMGESESLHDKIAEKATMMINSCYGTDPRHKLIGNAVADAVLYNKPMPWSLPGHFGGF